VKTEVLESLDAVGPAAWQTLHAATALRSPFLTWTWQSEWAQAFAPGDRLEIWRVLDDAGRLLGVLPLYEATPGVFRLIGGVDVSDYLDLIAEAGREAEVWAALLASRPVAQSVWDLHSVPSASLTVTHLAALAAEHGVEATVALLKALIPSLDNLERALGAEAARGGALREGVELTYRDLLAALQAKGLVVEDPAGHAFDPTRHEALSHEPAPGFAEGDVVKVLRKGYSFGDRLLRPALVKVAKEEDGSSGTPREKVH